LIKRALVSVTDKSGIVDFCRSLHDEFGIEIVSTGGTAAALLEANVPVIGIEDVTGFPEMMDGRVKTLHPKVHGGLLARRTNNSHMRAVEEHDIVPIDLVVVNLYAFKETISKAGVSEEDAIENIDIGGPSMLRSAAKNFESVTVLTRPDSYREILDELRENSGSTTLATRRALAQQVFALTSAYDLAIADYLSAVKQDNPASLAAIELEKVQDLRYGENPHQKATFYRHKGDISNSLAAAQQLQGKELSYNNILDTDAAWAAVRELDGPSCVIVKHTNPCGAASNEDIVRAYKLAWAGDPISAFGGIIAINVPATVTLVEAIFANKQFVEVFIAPDFEKSALDLLRTKPNMRVLKTGGVNIPGGRPALRSVEGGVLVQDEDTATEDPKAFVVAGAVQLDEDSMDDLIFAWKMCKSVKSNAITIARAQQLRGMGAGQPNRVNSARIAIEQARRCASTEEPTAEVFDPAKTAPGTEGCVAASDAFIPFPDTVEVLAEAGIKAIIQPGGSIRDEEVLAAADKAGMAMVFTGHRHFRH